MYKNILLVGAGGALGSILRFLLYFFTKNGTQFPIGTLLVNIIGCFLIGFIYGIDSVKKLHSNIIYFGVTGFCGGFTTFSTFSYDNFLLLKIGRYDLFFYYTIISFLVCLIGVILGFILSSTIFKHIYS